MLVLLKSTYPPRSAKKMIEVFSSPQTPPLSAAAKEVLTFTYGDKKGYHGLVVLDVEDGKLAEFFPAQTARSVNSLHIVWDTCIIEKKLGTDPQMGARDLLGGLAASE